MQQGDEQAISPLVVDRIQRTIAEELVSRGYPIAGEGEPADFLVAWHTVVRQKTDITVRDDYYGGSYYRWRSGYGSSTTYVREYNVGTLLIDFADAETENLGLARPRGRRAPEQPHAGEAQPAHPRGGPEGARPVPAGRGEVAPGRAHSPRERMRSATWSYHSWNSPSRSGS